MSHLLDLWHQFFGVSYGECLAIAVMLGMLLGVYTWALDIDPWAWLLRKMKNPRGLRGS